VDLAIILLFRPH